MKPIKIETKKIERYSVSPYNFVSFPSKVVVKYKDVKELPKHNNFKNSDGKDLLSGCIEYTLKAETPIMVAAGDRSNTEESKKNKEFFRNIEGEYAIPGNTIRGMIRTNSQILSFSSIAAKGSSDISDIQDSSFLFYRDFSGGNSLSKRYKNILGVSNSRILKNVKAGYIFKEKGSYYIKPAKVFKDNISYLRIDERTLKKIARNVTGISYIHQDGQEKYDNEKNNNESKKYNPYKVEISYEYSNEDLKVTKIGNLGECKNKGYILSGGYVPRKQSHYIVKEEDSEVSEFIIPEKLIDLYLDDLIATKKMDKAGKNDCRVKKGYEFWALPKDDERKPVFYINHNNVLHFGFTPYLRLSFGKKILDGVSSKYKEVDGISYTDSIFGFINREINGYTYNYKSRVSFDDAVALGDPDVGESSIEMLLAEPKPTSYNLYLVQPEINDKKNLKIYEEDDKGSFCLRGFKQYWLKDYIEIPKKDYIEIPKIESEKMSFFINPLKEGAKFRGKIFFKNLDEDELGLLLWSLKLNEDCYQNIGLAKPYGYGRVKVEGINLKIENINKKYSSFSFDYMEKADVEDYIKIYKGKFSEKYLDGKSIEDEKSIKELMKIKSKIVKRSEGNRYRYMSIRLVDGKKKLNEYSKRFILPEILVYDELTSMKEEKLNYNNQKKNNEPTNNKSQNSLENLKRSESK